MKDYIDFIENEISGHKESLDNHRIYGLLSEIKDIRIFMEKHVYAVWDFMSLLKALQYNLTCTTIPWKPVKNAKTARFINEIVLGEESDLNVNGIPKSHFEMYLDAMEELGANTSKVKNLTGRINAIAELDFALVNSDLKPATQSFLKFTFDTIKSEEVHKIAAAFTFGREDLIPDMFMRIIEKSDNDYSHFKYYLERHIELDGDEHGPLSIEMIRELCGADKRKWDDVLDTAKEALTHRIKLWDEIANEIEEKKLVHSNM